MTLIVRPCRDDDLAEADRIFRLAFGTFLGLPDPLAFAGDDRLRPRPLAARARGRLRRGARWHARRLELHRRWGRVGFFGPLSVRPDLWDRGIAQRLLEPSWRVRGAGHRRTRGSSPSRRARSTSALYGKLRLLPALPDRAWWRAGRRGVGGRRLGPLRRRSTSRARRAVLDGCRRIADGSPTRARPRARDRRARRPRTRRHDPSPRRRGAARLRGLPRRRRQRGGRGTCYVKFGAIPADCAARTHSTASSTPASAFAAARGATIARRRHRTWRATAPHARLRAGGFRTVIQGVAHASPERSRATSRRRSSRSTTGGDARAPRTARTACWRGAIPGPTPPTMAHRETRAAAGSPAGPAESERCARRGAYDRRSWSRSACRSSAWHSPGDRRGTDERLVRAPDRDRPRGRPRRRAPVPSELARRAARRRYSRSGFRSPPLDADGGGVVGEADLGQERHPASRARRADAS